MDIAGWHLPVVLAAGVVVAGFSAWLTGRVRLWALRQGVLDIPNERSSHVAPTPRGGGLSIVVTVLGGIFVLALFMPLSIPWLWMLFVSGALIVAVGLMDDIFTLKKRIRFSIHILAAVIIVLWMGSQLTIIFPRALNLTGPVATILVILYVVWNINAYNFMDGIDGLAAGHAVVVGLVAGMIAWFNGNPVLGIVYFLVAAASAGFLRWNWQPAKIFMGDLCSGFLGVTFAVLGLWGKLTRTVPLTAFLILMAVFYIDPTYTVIRRLLAGENITQTHRDFAFHHAIRRGHSHARVTGAILLIDLLWLTPLAVWTVLLRSNWSIPVLVLAYLPLFIGAVVLKAGVRLNDGLDPRDLAKKKNEVQ